ncbi:MAG: A24 family peptidase [Endomicrobium sp.]|jgi:leader peptidase (prepilin peptidase)/N-methyltransferase|nr:A24 family peptidase [Endomicrobium sp.]
MSFLYIKILVVFYIGFKAGNIVHKSLLVKLISAFSLIFLFYEFSFSLQFLMFSIFAFSLISASVIDYFHRIIPVIIPPFLFGTGLIFSFFNPILGESYFFRFLNAIFGIIAGGGVLFLIGIIGQFFYKKEVMGGGDIKLMVGVGAFIGAEKVLLAIFIAAVLGSIHGLIFILFNKRNIRETYIPFGPFLSLASFVIIFIPRPVQLFTEFFTWETKILGV